MPDVSDPTAAAPPARRAPTAVAIVGAVALFAWVGGALVTSSSAGAALGWVGVAHWELDDGTRTLWDSTGNGLHGVVGDRVAPGVAWGGAVGHSFPGGADSVDGGRLDVVGDDPRLDPGGRVVAITVRLLTTQPTGNVVQKGQARSAGGYFKVETTGGRAYCVFRGSSGTAAVGSGRRVDDGTWHTIRCERVGSTITMSVDGWEVDRRQRATGSIANGDPVTIGGKPYCNQVSVDCDYFAGLVDHVRIDLLGDAATGAVPPPDAVVK